MDALERHEPKSGGGLLAPDLVGGYTQRIAGGFFMPLMVDVESLLPLSQAKQAAMTDWLEAVAVHFELPKGTAREHQACLQVMAAQRRYDELARALASAFLSLIQEVASEDPAPQAQVRPKVVQ